MEAGPTRSTVKPAEWPQSDCYTVSSLANDTIAPESRAGQGTGMGGEIQQIESYHTALDVKALLKL